MASLPSNRGVHSLTVGQRCRLMHSLVLRLGACPLPAFIGELLQPVVSAEAAASVK
jgi:hypothetical protein